jgi:hypothetical protein
MKNKFFIYGALALSLAGCSLPQGTRKITAWGIGAIPTGGIPIPIIGYWHSEHGENVESEESAKPPTPELRP